MLHNKKRQPDEDVFYLDINAEFLEDNGELPKSIMPDPLHPNEKVYEIRGKAMEPVVEKLMGEPA